MTKNAAIYARQSITREGSASLDIQVETCRDVASRFGLDVVAELVEPPSTSGFKNRGRDRPKFKELLALIESGQVDAVIVYQTDRLSRGGGVGWTPLLEAFEKRGLDTSHSILRPDGWLSEFELGIRAAIDREEASKTSARMLDVRAREAREGKPRTGVCRGYGYEYSKDTKQLTVVDSEAKTIRDSAERVLAGESVYSVTRDLNRRGVPSVTGRGWSTSVLAGVLRSPRVAGLRSHLGAVVAKGQWDAILTEDEHHRIVAITANRHCYGAKRAPRTFPLVGFLLCGKCGKPLRSIVSTARETRRRRYVCKSSDNLGGCGGIQIKAEFVEDAVRDYVIGVISDPELRDGLLAAAPAPDDTARLELVAELRNIDLARQRLTDLAVDGTISKAEVQRKTIELDDRVAAVERRLADQTTVAIARLPLSATDLDVAWCDGDISFQRQLIGLLIESVTVGPATRLAPGRFDTGRLTWSLRC